MDTSTVYIESQLTPFNSLFFIYVPLGYLNHISKCPLTIFAETRNTPTILILKYIYAHAS